jgi:hypothetical protein
MSTYTHTDPDGDKLTINEYTDEVILGIETVNDYLNFSISKADAPRVALELLKAAGRTKEDADSTDSVDAHVGVAIRRLEAALEFAEAVDKAKLDQEADTLRVTVADGLLTWDETYEDEREHWRNVALAARELHKDGNE